MNLVEAVAGALAGVEGDTVDVAHRLAALIVAEGASPSLVRECRYALVALGVVTLEPYRLLMVATKAAIDRSDASLPTLAAQLRETEQLCRRLSGEPANRPVTRAVVAAVDGIVGLWREAWEEFELGVGTDWGVHRARSAALWHVVNSAGGESVYPLQCERADVAFAEYWAGRRRARRQGGR